LTDIVVVHILLDKGLFQPKEENVDTKKPENNIYDLKSIKLPYLSGLLLRIFVNLVEGPLGRLIFPSLFESSGINQLRRQKLDESPTFLPLEFSGKLSKTSSSVPEKEWPAKPLQDSPGFHFTSVMDYATAYRQGSLTPEEVASRVLSAIESSNTRSPAMNAIIAVNKDEVMKQAAQSAERIKSRKPLSILDGVPVAVKDELDLKGYPTTVGTSFLGTSIKQVDSTAAARMRAAGALLIGKANMHEIGIGVTGLNPNTGTTRNPYNTDHFTGGSSSGPAAAVASGLCPIAIGADGGGSIRIPASFCGIFGIKPTFGRVSEFGAYPLCWSVAHVGPLAASAADTALAYAVMAGPDLNDPNSLHQPLPTIRGWDKLNMKRLKLGIFKPWFEHADQEVVSACEAMIANFEKLGAKVFEISIPGLEDARAAHSVIILSEMFQSMSATYPQHHKDHGLEVRTNLALAKALTASDYVQAQKVRSCLIKDMKLAMEQVDMILTPATALVAPHIPDDALPDGNSDLTTVIEIMRFATQANMTGQPAISFPVGYNHQGLPIGMQAIGRYWEEAGLLGLARVSEQFVERLKPDVYSDLLKG
jgi:Asp-tRNA(Asn)/Glu-tRNA(Gln) amidotransferase A subunit family amidase